MLNRMDGAWDLWRNRLLGQLESLSDGEFLNTWGPTQTRERGTGIFGRARKPEVVSAPVVRFLCTEGSLLVESVPAFPTAHDPRLSDEQRRELSAAGWLMPGDEGYERTGGEDLRVLIPQGDAARAADLAVATYRVLHVDDPTSVEQERAS